MIRHWRKAPVAHCTCGRTHTARGGLRSSHDCFTARLSEARNALSTILKDVWRIERLIRGTKIGGSLSGKRAPVRGAQRAALAPVRGASWDRRFTSSRASSCKRLSAAHTPGALQHVHDARSKTTWESSVCPGPRASPLITLELGRLAASWSFVM